MFKAPMIKAARITLGFALAGVAVAGLAARVVPAALAAGAGGAVASDLAASITPVTRPAFAGGAGLALSGLNPVAEAGAGDSGYFLPPGTLSFYDYGAAGGIEVKIPPNELSGAPSRVIYFTPRVANFQVGVSFAQKSCGLIAVEAASCYGNGNSDAGGRVLRDDQQVELGLTYNSRLSEIDLGLSSSVVPALRDDTEFGPMTPELKRWNVGLSAGYLGFTVNTSYFEDRAGDDAGSDANPLLGRQETYDIGVKYGSGPWSVGVQYSHSAMEQLQIGTDDARDQNVDAYEIGGTYVIGSALTLGATVQYWQWDRLAGVANEDGDNRALVFLIGSVLKF